MVLWTHLSRVWTQDHNEYSNLTIKIECIIESLSLHTNELYDSV